MSELILKAVKCCYGKKVILDNVSFTLNNGVTALLGLNGAGKTTLIKNIMKLIEPKSGEIIFDGKNIYHMGNQYFNYVGYMPQMPELYDNFKAYDFLLYMSSLKGIKHKEAVKKADILLEKVYLTNDKNKKIKTFSGGMKQRLGIAQALLNDPQLIILDEPTAGLDPNERIKFRNIITELGSDSIVILATHIISDVESIAKNILLVKDGKVMLCNNPKEFVDFIKGSVYTIKVPDKKTLIDINKNNKVSNIREVDDGYEIRVVGNGNGLENYRHSISEPNLEDAFLVNFGK